MEYQRIAVSGTYSTGKTTTTEALSLLTRVPKTEARTMREILPEVFPGKMLEECSAVELGQLGLIRFRERILKEAEVCGPMISDGSCLHEWVYGKGRLSYGMNPGQNLFFSRLKAIVGFRVLAKARNFIEIYGGVAKYHARRSYDVFIHLPVEFPIVEDGHRPVSDRFRLHTDALLKDTLEEIGIKYYVVGGTIEDRLEHIVDVLQLKKTRPTKEAIEEAQSIVYRKTKIVEESQRRESELLRRRGSLLRRLLYKVLGR